MSLSYINNNFRNFDSEKKPTFFILPDNTTFNALSINKLTVNDTLQLSNATGYFGNTIFTNQVYLPAIQSQTLATAGPTLVLNPATNQIQKGLGNLTYIDQIYNNPFESNVDSCIYNNYIGTEGTQFTAVYSDVNINGSFNVNTNLDNYGKAVAQLADGRVVVGGLFNNYGGSSTEYLVVLNSDGSLNTSFNPGFNGIVRSIKTQVINGNEKIVVVGSFTSYAGNPQNRIIRFNSDFTIDGTFNIGSGFNNDVWSVEIQPDNKILLGGFFTSYDGNTSNRLVRLNVDGSFDNTFVVPGTGFNSRVQKVIVLSNGKILCGGQFTDYNGNSVGYIARLNADGTFDNSFNQGTGFSSNVIALAETSDNQYLVGGQFSSYNGTSIGFYFARLNNDGTLDTSLNTGSGFDNFVNAIVIDNDGNYILGGWFNNYDSSSPLYICKLFPDGTLDDTFALSFNGFNDMVYDLLLVDNGINVFAVGNFEFKYYNFESYYVVKLSLGDCQNFWQVSVPVKTTTFRFFIDLDGSGNMTNINLAETYNWDPNEVQYSAVIGNNFIAFSSPTQTVTSFNLGSTVSSNGNGCPHISFDPWNAFLGFNGADYGSTGLEIDVIIQVKLR